MNVNGYIGEVLVKQGAITADDFIDWFANKVLLYTEHGQILVIDNAFIHRDARLPALCALYSICIEYLPPYSPDYNPIERSFH